MFRIFVIGLVISQAAAVLNKAERREAPADTYGPPTSINIDLPTPVYGVPTGPVARYPPPPPDVPPPPTQYGVPAFKYGPPKPHFSPKPVYGPPPSQHHHTHHHHQQHHFHKAQHEVSFLDQLKSTFGFGAPSTNYGPPPSTNYGPPPQHHHKPHFPKPSYGPPISGPLLPPVKNFGGNFAQGSFSSSSSLNLGGAGHAPAPVVTPIPTYGPPPHLGPHFPNPDIRCDGWKPIPGPAIQPNTNYGVPVTSGSGYNGNVEFGHGIESAAAHIGVSQGAGDSIQSQIFELPKVELSQPFSGGLSSGKSNSFEVSQRSPQFPRAISYRIGNSLRFFIPQISSNGISDSYGPPPSGLPHTTYGPPAPLPSYGPPKASNAYLPPAKPSLGLLPPSGVYGVPPGGSYSSLAISHGSVSGNLKPWPVSGTPPNRPIINRPPVPNGLLESIGHQVKHFESFHGGKFNQNQNTYLPPPPPQIIDIQAPHGLNSLPLENSVRPFLTQHNTQGGLPLIHEPRGIIGVGGSDCGHGPSNLHLQQPQHLSIPQPIQDSYGPPPSGNIFTSQAAAFGGIEGHSNFIAPAISTSLELPVGHVPHVEYGVPKFNQFSGDSVAFGSSVKSETVKITGEKVNVQPKENAINVEDKPSKTLEPPTNQLLGEQSTASPFTAPAEDIDEEATRLDVAGLTGLDVVSAQKSQSITIPVQGAQGNYELQFQSTDQTGSGSAPHEQLLSEGLLQQILSAIEQPGSNNGPGQQQQQPVVVDAKSNVPQVTQDEHTDHDDVKIFLKSPEADPIINEPPMV